MEHTESDGMRERAVTPHGAGLEVVPGRPGTDYVAAVPTPLTLRRFCAAMYDYCLTPQYWEVF